MRNTIYIILFLSILSCNKKENNPVQNKLFLENYNGVVWENDKWFQGSEETRYLIFSNSTTFLTAVFYQNGNMSSKTCSNIIEGKNQWNNIIKIISNSDNKFSFSTDEVISNFTVVNGGNSLEWVDSDDPNFTEHYTRKNISNPCQ